MPKELYIKNTTNGEKSFIANFESREQIATYLSQLYSISSLNEKQYLLILNDYSKDGKEIVSRHFIGCFETQEALQKFLNDGHEIVDNDEEELKKLVHDKIVELEELEASLD